MVGRRLFVLAALIATLGAPGGRAAAPEPRLVVFYVEAPPATRAAVMAALEVQVRTDQAAGVQAEALSETGRPGRMVLVERWRDLSEAEAGRRAKALAARLGPDLQAPVDDRLNDPIVALDAKPAPAGAFHMLMHIDVMPDGAATARQALLAQKALVMVAPGALAFEAATQTGRPNHFAVLETWKSRAAYESYAASAAGQDLRLQLDRFKGAPFDDRFYGS
jgi:quinol monooxygenase YgiN